MWLKKVKKPDHYFASRLPAKEYPNFFLGLRSEHHEFPRTDRDVECQLLKIYSDNAYRALRKEALRFFN